MLLVADAMTGQEAVSVAQTFNERVGLTGLILTKMDGDARGGAALSIRAVTGVPIKFMGTGEKLDALQPFYPDRLAGRILGMGDMLTLIERTQDTTTRRRRTSCRRSWSRGSSTWRTSWGSCRRSSRWAPGQPLLEMIPGLNQLNRDRRSRSSRRQAVQAGRGDHPLHDRGERRNPVVIDGSDGGASPEGAAPPSRK